MELHRAPLVTEASMRAVFREELGCILALLQQALGTETCRLPEQLAASNASTDVDAVQTSCSTLRSASSDRHVIGTGKGADMMQDSAEGVHSLEKSMVRRCAKDVMQRISGQSQGSSAISRNLGTGYKATIEQNSIGSCVPCESSDLSLPSPTHSAHSALGCFLPGEVASPESGKQRRRAARSSSGDSAERYSVLPSALNIGISNSDKQAAETPTVALVSSRASSKERRESKSSHSSRESQMPRASSKDRRESKQSSHSSRESQNCRTVEKHNQRVRTPEDTTVQATSNFTLRRCAARIVGHSIFDYSVTAFIMLNGVLVGVQTDHMAREFTDETPIFFQVLEMIFCAVFTVELCLRLCAFGSSFVTMSGRGWNLFDLFVVTAQILEISMEVIASGVGYSFNLLRVLRLIRVVRLARALRLIGELRTIVSSIAGSMKPLFWTGILLFMVMYVLGVYITQVVLSRRIAYRERNDMAPVDLEFYWGSLGKSIMSLFQSITGGIDWDQVARPLAEHISPEMGILFSIYIGFTVLCILNVVTGVFIESVMKNAKSENEFRAMNHVMRLFAKLDVNKTGEISWEDFQNNLDKKEMQEFFKTIDVEIDNAQTLFELLDVDSSGAVDIREFMDGCLSIWAPTRGLDLRMILRDVNKVLSILHEEKKRCQQLEACETCAGG